MGLMKAALLAPDAVLLPTDFDEYRRYSRLFKAAVAEVAPVIEDRGIDEIYIDLTEVPGAQDAVGHDAAAACAPWRRRSATTCAQATGPELLDRRHAQQAAGQDRQRTGQARRPDGADRGRHRARIWPLPVRRINGIGPKAGAGCRRWASPPSASWPACSARLAGGALRPQLRPLAARRQRTASTTGRW
jgi:DNA polymerase-4